MEYLEYWLYFVIIIMLKIVYNAELLQTNGSMTH